MNKTIIFPSGKQISAARQLLKYSQKDLANKINMNVTTIIKIESDIGNPTLGTMIKIMKVFDDERIFFINKEDEEGVVLRKIK